MLRAYLRSRDVAESVSVSGPVVTVDVGDKGSELSYVKEEVDLSNSSFLLLLLLLLLLSSSSSGQI